MSKLIAVVCTGEYDFMKYINNLSDVIGVINWRAITTNNKTLLKVDKINCIRGLKLNGYETTAAFNNRLQLENKRMDKELISSVGTRVVK